MIIITVIIIIITVISLLLLIIIIIMNPISFMMCFLICRYDEVCKYNFDNANPEFDMETGHFTQVVWKDSIALGMGKAEGKDSKGRPATFIVGRYRPPGNYNGQFKENVQRGRFDSSYCNNK